MEKTWILFGKRGDVKTDAKNGRINRRKVIEIERGVRQPSPKIDPQNELKSDN